MVQDSSTYWKRSRVELRAAGFDPDRAANTSAVVTIASAWTNAHRCNNRVRGIADMLIDVLAERGGQGLVVGAPAVSDALTQGTPTAGYSLVSRDVVADCIEIGHYAHHGDAMIVISGCDKTGAAALMPLARTNAFGLVLYPGTARTIEWNVAPVTVVFGRLDDAAGKPVANATIEGVVGAGETDERGYFQVEVNGAATLTVKDEGKTLCAVPIAAAASGNGNGSAKGAKGEMLRLGTLKCGGT